jgi:hypothetical protein
MLDTSTISATMTVHGKPTSPLRLVWHYEGDRLTCRWITAAEEPATTVHLRPVA